ncbi:MAG: hypothetical protein OSA93_02050 [Akkermansiaceae bacterium]|jgi:hypothetical protein|nr:hypothetical protein [Akkermansiaceae bacterium]
MNVKTSSPPDLSERLQQVPLIANPKNLFPLIDETDQLERILNTSISTVKGRK